MKKVIMILIFVFTTAHAGVSPPLTLTQIRSHILGGSAYIYVSTSSWCSTSVYQINLSAPGGKEAYDDARLAFALGKRVRVEVTGACGYWGVPINSIYVLN